MLVIDNNSPLSESNNNKHIVNFETKDLLQTSPALKYNQLLVQGNLILTLQSILTKNNHHSPSHPTDRTRIDVTVTKSLRAI